MGKTFEEFSETVISHIKDYLPESYMDASVNIEEIEKNNGKLLHGLVIKRPGETLVPVLYLESFFETYQKGTKIIEYILLDMASMYLESAGAPLDFAGVGKQLIDWEKVKGLIGLRLLNTDWNTSRLSVMPFIPMEDLAIIFDIALEKNVHVQVTQRLLDKWGIDISELYDQAVRNMVPEKVSLVPMNQIIGGVVDPMLGECTGNVYVLSNKSKLFGASVCAYPGVLKRIYEQIGDFVILPSSVHEVLLAAGEFTDVDYMREMVMEVNEAVVEPEERLSNNIYRYDPVLDKMVLIPAEEEEYA